MAVRVCDGGDGVAERNVAHHAEEHAKEVTRYEERKEWIDRLYAALPEKP